MQPFKRYRSWWEKKVRDYPHVAHTTERLPPPQVRAAVYGEFISAPDEDPKGYGCLWGFLTREQRDAFVEAFASHGASKVTI
jgi:hypothetical protein